MRSAVTYTIGNVVVVDDPADSEIRVRIIARPGFPFYPTRAHAPAIELSEPPGRVVAPDIFQVDHQDGLARDLLDLVVAQDGWTPSSVADEARTYVSSVRTSSSLRLSSYPDLEVWRTRLDRTVLAAVRQYREHCNSHVKVSAIEGYEVLRYTEGQAFGQHVDTVYGHAQLGRRQLSVVFFLNDDFDGGDVSFPRQSHAVRPQAGSLLLFPSGPTHPHESTAVTRGTKYAVVTWLL